MTQRAARRLPRAALLILCAAYVLPGVFGRDPWRNADLTAFATMLSIAEGRSSWLAPALGGVPVDLPLLPHWLGAAFISALSPLVEPALAARVPFAALLGIVLALTWYTCFQLARTEAAQPVPFAFGGEAEPVDYARAMADGAVLALIATLGLLQLGHETTPELLQLTGVALYLWALASAPFRGWRSVAAVLVALPMMAGSGAPSMAMTMGVAGAAICLHSRYPEARRFGLWVLLAVALAALLGWLLGGWRARPVPHLDPPELLGLLRQWAWFLWPAWPLVLWTLWRWRWHLTDRHLSVPLTAVLAALAANVWMGGNDRALMLGLPGMAVLAAFALPTLRRSATAAIDWFSMFFFSLCAVAIWGVYASLMVGTPAKPAANVKRLMPGFEMPFSWPELAFAVAGTLAWLWLLRWRTGRHRHAIWKSMVLPAGGVALCWLLLMSIALPILDQARGVRVQMNRIARWVPAEACIAAPGLPAPVIAALESARRWTVDARPGAAERASCGWMVRTARGAGSPAAPAGWAAVGEARRPTDRGGREERLVIYRRSGSS
jgi:hypothetical protein